MIPKIIHLCWLSGDSYPPKIAKCLESWKKFLPDYEVMLWDTKRFDLNSSVWVRQAFENKKYAFAADYIRFYALLRIRNTLSQPTISVSMHSSIMAAYIWIPMWRY